MNQRAQARGGVRTHSNADGRENSKMPIGRRGLIVPQNTFLEDVIRRSDDLYESFIVGSAEIADYPVVYCSEGFSQMTGFKRSEVMKMSCDGKFLFGPSVKKEVSENIQNALRMKKDCQVEFIGRKKDGTLLWYLFHLAPIENEANTVVLFLVTLRDISEFKEPITENGNAAQKWAKLTRSLKKERSAFVVAFSKTKEEKNKIRIAQLMVQNTDLIPQYKQQIPKPPKWVVLHYSPRKVVWDWFVLLFILYTVSAVPFVFCFDYKSIPMTVVDCMVDAFFLADILLNFHTSYIGQDGEVITDLKQIRRSYLRSWFVVDLITSLPYGLLSLVGSSNSVFVNLVSFFKGTRLLRVSRVIRKLDHFINYGFITLILCLVVFLLCAHLMACVFYLIASEYDDFNEVGWVATLAKQTNQKFNVTKPGDKELPTLPSRYVSSLYYCLTSLTTIGFGNISPNTTAEKIFGCITMIVGALGYAVIFGQVTAIVQQAQKQSEKYHGLLDNIKSFQKLYRVPVNLSARILDYFMSTWALTKGVDTDEVLKQCPKDLQSDICIHLNRKVLYKNPAFSSMPMSVMRTIARNFCICHVAPGDRVVHEGESLDVLYFISHGSFEVKQDGHVVGLLGRGDVFGDDVCNEVNVGKSVADVYALTYSDIHCIDRNDLREVLMIYPESGVEFSRKLKLSFNLRNQPRKRKSSTLSYQEGNIFETRDASFQLSNRPARLSMQARGGRRLSMVQELTQTIDLEAGNFEEMNIYGNDSSTTGNGGERACRRPPDPTSVNVINEENEIGPLASTANAQMKSYTNMNGLNQRARLGVSHQNGNIEREVSQLRTDIIQEINEMNLKLNRAESQLSLILSLLQDNNNNKKPDLKARHCHSFPSETTYEHNVPSLSHTRNEHAASSTNYAASQEEEVTSSPKWLSPKSSRSTPENSEDRRKTSVHSSRDKGAEDGSPSLLVRHGRRKINHSSDT